MLTYQDLLGVGSDERQRMDFVLKAINRWKVTSLYRNAVDAARYFKGENVTITNFQKVITKVTGEQIPDVWSANYKIPSNFFYRFTNQKVQFLLANGITWNDEGTADKLGAKKAPIDTQTYKICIEACKCGVAFGFFNNDHVEVFSCSEFVPFYDEEDSALKAGIRFWQIDEKKPLRATLYELDGYTDYIWINGQAQIKHEKRSYKHDVRESQVGDTEMFNFSNYPTFPIVPMWGNSNRQSDLNPIRAQIDAYDLIKSGFCNTIDEASFVYWTITNAGGMQDDISLEDFVRKLKTLHAVAFEDEAQAQPNTVQAPFESREALLKRLENDLYRDAMALDVTNISGGAATATEIKAAYEPLNSKADDFEYCVLEFLDGIMAVAGIEDNATFTRSMLVNVSEDINTLIASAAYLTPEYITEKILNLFGDGDKADEIIAQMNAERLGTLTNAYKGKSISEEENDAQSGVEGE